MSFTNLDVDLESQTPFSDSPEFDRITEQCSNTLLDVNNHLVTLAKFVKSLETRKFSLSGSANVNDKAVKTIEKITESFKSLSSLKREFVTFNDLNPAQRFTKDKITREIKSCLDEFQELQGKFTKITAVINQEAKTAMNEDIDSHVEGNTGQQQQSQQQHEIIIEQDVINNEEFVYQQNLIREREEEIRNIEHGIEELNEIFQDLGNIVQEQGTMVDNIESNIYNVSHSTRNAASELSKALKYQKRSGKRSLCMLIIICIILSLVLLVIFI